MPQVVDLEVLMCGGGCGEGKVACETLIDIGGGPKPANPPLQPPPPDDPDLPAESFRLPVEDVIDWLSRSAVAPYDRDGSTRGVTNPKSAPHHHPNPKLHSSSQRSYAKPKGLIIGLPNNIQSSGYLGQSARRQHAAHGRFFPKKCGDQSAAGSGRTAVPELEPTSPKVSCFGRVLSDQDQNRHRRASTTPDVSRESSSVAAAAAASTWESTGFWASVLGFSCCGQRGEAALLGEDEPVSSTRAAPTAPTNGKITPSASVVSGKTVMAAPVPGLGGMKRFVSGRRTASWGSDLDLEEVEDGARWGPSPQRRGEGILPGRRSVGSLADLDCDRDWESAGAASV